MRPANLRLTFRLARGRPVLHIIATVSSASSGEYCKTAAVDLHTDAQCPALEHLSQVSFLAEHFERGCCFIPQNCQRGRGLFETCRAAEVPGRSGCCRVIWENGLTATTVEDSALRKDFEKSLVSTCKRYAAIDNGLGVCQRQLSCPSVDLENFYVLQIGVVHSLSSTSPFSLPENITMDSSSFDWH